jgi:hypothetical protein
MTCGKFKVGYKGQRYQVFAKDEAEDQEFEVGWTDAPDGGALVKMVNAHPSWHSPRVADLGVAQEPKK